MSKRKSESVRIREAVEAGIAGYAIRQAQRDLKRIKQNQRSMICRARTEGKIDNQEDLQKFLDLHQYRVRRDKVFGCTVVLFECGMEICYRPDGFLDKHAPRRLSQSNIGLQEDLFAEPTVSTCDPSSSGTAHFLT